MGRYGPRRLTFRQIVASAYPGLFRVVVRLNRAYGSDIAISKGVSFLAFLSCALLFLLGIWILLASGWRPEQLGFWLLIPALAIMIGFDRLHQHLLIRRRIGLRFLKRYKALHSADQLWVNVAAATALVLCCAAFWGLLLLIAPMRPTVVVVTTGPATSAPLSGPDHSGASPRR